jgi:hypothetical protein
MTSLFPGMRGRFRRRKRMREQTPDVPQRRPSVAEMSTMLRDYDSVGKETVPGWFKNSRR